MAPMVAASDYPFRCLLRQHGVDLCFTQMMHAKNLVNDKQFRKTHLDLLEFLPSPPPPLLLPQQERFLQGSRILLTPDDERTKFTRGPLIAQLAGHDVDAVVQAAAVLMESSQGQLTGIDLNLGCPQHIARKGHYGAFIMEDDPQRVYDILTALSTYMAESYPQTMVSAKIRLPLDDSTLAERIPRLIQTGISFLTIHGRTLHENKTKVRACHVDRMTKAIQTARAVQPDFPVIANGGIETYDDVIAIQQQTDATAVMSSEALLETPNVFMSSSSSSKAPPQVIFQQQFQFAHDYLDWCTRYPPLPGVLGNHGSLCICRGHLFKFLHRYLQEHPDLRDALGSPKLTTCVQLRDIVDTLQSRYDDDTVWSVLSSQPNASWYRRHRDALERVHTRRGGATPIAVQALLSVPEKKALLRTRIAKLQQQNKEKAMSSSSSSVL
eukprot:Sro995_g229170.2  (439) ;mRNA; r:19155-20471